MDETTTPSNEPVVETPQTEKKKRSPAKRFETLEELTAAAEDIETRVANLLTDIAAMRRSIPDILEGFVEENKDLKAKFDKIREATTI